MHHYDVESQSFGLGDLAEDSDEGEANGGTGKRTSFDDGPADGALTPRSRPKVEKEHVKPKGVQR